MSNARIVMNDTLRVFGVLAAIFSIPVVLLLVMPEFPRWIARVISGM